MFTERPPVSGSGRALAMAILVATALVAAGCDLLPLPGAGWKVDVVNGDRPLLISITTDRAAWAWLVPADAEIVLLGERNAPAEGRIELIDPERDCLVLDAADLPRSSLTIAPKQVGADLRAYELVLDAGAPLVGPASQEFFGGCSG